MECRLRNLAPGHGDLVAEDHEFDVFVGLACSMEDQEPEEAPKHYIEALHKGRRT